MKELDKNTILQEGQRVRCALPYAGTGTIYKIHGEQRPASVKQLGGGCIVMGGIAHFDIVYDNGTQSQFVPESVVRGIQWTIYDEIATPEEIKMALERADKHETQKEQEREAQAKAREVERERISKNYPYLKQYDRNGKTSSHALGAKNIKTELSRAFPGVKFSVRSDSFSGGDSIDIDWTDGPTTKEVEKITDKYNKGTFDGMIDLYEYNSDNVWPDIYGGAKYVMENRSLSAEAIRGYCKEHDHDPELFDERGNIKGDFEAGRRVMREMDEHSFYASVAHPAPVTPKPEKPKSDGVIISEYKGHPVITLPNGHKGFSFGVGKAKSILAHIQAIEQFVNDNDNA